MSDVLLHQGGSEGNLRRLPTYGQSYQVVVGQRWASLHGGIYDTLEVVEVLDGQYLRPPDVALIPCEFCRVKWRSGRLKGQTTDQRAPGHRLGWASGHVLLEQASDGSALIVAARRLIEWQEARDAA